MSTSKKSALEKAEAKAQAIGYLKEYLKPGDTVYVTLRHVSGSRMSRSITALIPTLSTEGKSGIYDITYLVAAACDLKIDDRHGGAKMGGCGSNMGFMMIYHLASMMWPDGFDCIGEHCPANDHSNRVDAKHHSAGGYALTTCWL